MPIKKINTLTNSGLDSSLKLMGRRLGSIELPRYHSSTVDQANDMAKALHMRGGFPQQERMIRDKLRTLDKATLYSYQAALIKKLPDDHDIGREDYKHQLPVRALINPDKNKVDYDDKILSTRFDNDMHPGDVFEWLRTNSYWLVYLQDLDEIAYFRGEIRRCDYTIEWLDEDGEKHKTFAAVRGPVETKINFIQKHSISVDEPNYSLHILMPKNEHTTKYFVRYAKFYLADADEPDNYICWRVEATDTISTAGILELTAVEYYANETEDDIENGLVGAKIEKRVEPEQDPKIDIIGPSWIKPKLQSIYYINTMKKGAWHIDSPTKPPIKTEVFKTEAGRPGLKITWTGAMSGQFTLWYGSDNERLFEKTIVVESLY